MKYVMPILIWLPRPSKPRIFRSSRCRLWWQWWSWLYFFFRLICMHVRIIMALFSFQYFQVFLDVRFVTFDSCCRVFICLLLLFCMAQNVYVFFVVFSAHCISQQQQYKANKLFDAIRCFEQTLCWFICDNSMWMTIINKIFECERSLAYRRTWMCKQMILNVYVFICNAQGYR